MPWWSTMTAACCWYDGRRSAVGDAGRLGRRRRDVGAGGGARGSRGDRPPRRSCSAASHSAAAAQHPSHIRVLDPWRRASSLGGVDRRGVPSRRHRAGLARRSPRAGGRSARCPIIASSMSRGVPDRAHRAAGNACAARGRWRRFSGRPSGGAADAGGAPSAASGIEPGRDMGVPSGQCLPAHACAPAVAGRAFAQVMLTRRAGDTADIHGRVTPPAYFHRRNSGPGELTEIRTE
jgi:hypothetical protein